MLNRSRRLTPLLALAVVLGTAAEGRAQADPQNFLFSSGQSIQPFFDGWSHHPDGGFDMHFGYLNRNYAEELHIPVGAANRMSPGEPDQGQATYFYPRNQRRVFSVTVPADWGDRRLEWQVTVGDETHRALGWLQPEWEIFANPAAARAGGQGDNQPPELTVTAPADVVSGEPAALVAAVTDDGLPPPRRRGGGTGLPPAFEPVSGQPTLPVNVPQLQAAARKRPLRYPGGAGHGNVDAAAGGGRCDPGPRGRRSGRLGRGDRDVPGPRRVPVPGAGVRHLRHRDRRDRGLRALAVRGGARVTPRAVRAAGCNPVRT